MPGKAAKVAITERQQEVLQRWVGSRPCPRGVAQRAGIILLAFDRLQNGPTADHLGCERHAVGVWRRRWVDAFDTPVRTECVEGLSAPEAAIEDVLSDNPRSGCPGTFAPDRIARIVAVACEPPEDSGRPVTHWTPTALAEEVVARRIAPPISARHVGRLLKVPNSSPHRSRYWLNANPKDPEAFAQHVRDVCDCYRAAPARLKSGVRTVRVDEMTGSGRRSGSPRPGRCGRARPRRSSSGTSGTGRSA